MSRHTGRGMGAGCISKIFFPQRKPRTRKAAGRGPEGGKNERKKKVRWKRMYVGHVAAGIASMCHRGNHAGNAEAHLTTLPPCIYLPRAIPYIFTVSVLPQTVRLPPFSVLLAPPSIHRISFPFPPRPPFLGTYFKEIRETRKSERENTESPSCPRILITQTGFKGRAASCTF